MKQMFIYVTFQKEFIHQYQDAPEAVYYLRYPHRHVAHIKVKIEVFNDDRELEFIMVKHQLENYLNLEKLTNNSCEQIANMLLYYIHEQYGNNRDVTIDISEDGENGCEVNYRKEKAC